MSPPVAQNLNKLLKFQYFISINFTNMFISESFIDCWRCQDRLHSENQAGYVQSNRKVSKIPCNSKTILCGEGYGSIKILRYHILAPPIF